MEPLMIVIPIILIGMAGQWILAYPLNVLQFGDEQASQLGVPVQRVRRRIIFFSTLTTAAAISFSGIIGFVGLIVPHVIRLLSGSDYRKLIPLSMLGGAFFLLTADVISRLVIAPQELPVGIITALTGAPFFLWLLQQTKHKDVL
jgi:iron complex transport system permease protein